jgi:hypothetical protein
VGVVANRALIRTIRAVPGADGIDFGQLVDMSLTIDGACADS